MQATVTSPTVLKVATITSPTVLKVETVKSANVLKQLPLLMLQSLKMPVPYHSYYQHYYYCFLYYHYYTNYYVENKAMIEETRDMCEKISKLFSVSAVQDEISKHLNEWKS
ncbi:hypothetical protein DPMN_052199 [Dreissena polymorpha]|uniref:Uncharacterized protein n=1 Tax=Dreissena polymorpha TaxID=45954 RepID=A0A9D4CKU1_DREPO|nr:hypothetical protein DPMN_052199 [Dreissena polymorpha]